MGSMARLEIPKDAAACCFGKCPNPSNRLISRLLEWPGWTGFSRTSPEIYDLGLCVFPRSNACRNSFAMERCQQFKVAAPQRGSLLLCKDDSWFYWFSHRECVPMAEWSIRTWRWRDIVYGVSVLQFWRFDARMMALLLHLPLQKFWFSSSEKFWSLSYKKKILNIHYSRNPDRRPLQWREDHPLSAISFLKNPPSTLNLLPNTLKPASQPPP